MPWILGLAGMGDGPDWIFLALFCVLPFHLFVALGGESALTLVGYGSFAVLLQVGLLAAWFGGITILIWKRNQKGFGWKGYGALALYPLITLSTNLIPTWILG